MQNSFTIRFLLLCALVAGIIVSLPGCVSPWETDLTKYKIGDVQYGVTRGTFRGRWWNYYERGRSFADGGFWLEAEHDLRRALDVRTFDKRRSRTYGLHYIQYFGNRELGVVLYRQGRFAAKPFRSSNVL